MVKNLVKTFEKNLEQNIWSFLPRVCVLFVLLKRYDLAISIWLNLVNIKFALLFTSATYKRYLNVGMSDTLCRVRLYVCLVRRLGGKPES